MCEDRDVTQNSCNTRSPAHAHHQPRLESSVVGNCSPARHAGFRHLAIAGWRIRNSKKGWRDLANFVKISENNRHLWVHKVLSMVLSVAKFYEIRTAGQSKEGHFKSPLKTNCCSLFGHCDPLIPFNFDLDNSYTDSMHSVVMKK